ncbi:MAG: transporter substrate-binding domain-containing protein [Proteobacteria bacterium]|nr:transporter substrate-binding domain-containing protein [Pseudomonadota bacterium]
MLKCVCALILAFVVTPEYAQTGDADTMTSISSESGRVPVPAVAPAREQAQMGKSTLLRIDANGILRVGIAPNAPWVMHDAHGAPIGYSIDVARKLASSMGWKVQFVENTWSNLVPGLRAHQYDVIISGLSITPQRARYVQFTDPISEFDVEIVVNRNRFPHGGIAELRSLGQAKVAARKGRVTVEFAHNALPQMNILEIDDEEAAIAELRAGKIDAYVAIAPLPYLLETLHPGQLRALQGEPIARTAHGFAVRRGDVDLQRVLDAWIVYEKTSGWLKERGHYWFETTGWASFL